MAWATRFPSLQSAGLHHYVHRLDLGGCLGPDVIFVA